MKLLRVFFFYEHKIYVKSFEGYRKKRTAKGVTLRNKSAGNDEDQEKAKTARIGTAESGDRVETPTE